MKAIWPNWNIINEKRIQSENNIVEVAFEKSFFLCQNWTGILELVGDALSCSTFFWGN